MQKKNLYQKIVLVIFITTALSSHAQKQFIHTATKTNNACNGYCTLLDVPELNNNPSAIIFATQVSEKGDNNNQHPIGVFYFKKQWSILNLDQTAIPAGVKFNVEFVIRPDENNFSYSISNNNIQRDGSAVIDHPALNNHPNIMLRAFMSWNPEIQSGSANREPVTVQYSTDAGKWLISNVNRKKPMYARITYNIIISRQGNIVTNPVKIDPLISKMDSKTIIKPAEPIPIITGPVNKKDIVAKKTIPKSYDFSKVQVCIEEITNKSLPPKTPVAPKPVIPKINSNGVLQPVTTVTQPLSLATNLMWSQGESISVGFLPGETITVINKVKKYAKEWETHANIKFVFINDVTKAMVKVGFKKDNLSWSWMGRDVLVNISEGRTMNLGWLDDQTNESEFRRVVLHEFGHVLGFIHEHQSPNAGIPWDTAKVYSFYGSEPNNWSHEKIDIQLFQKYSATSTNSSTYDKLSIMHYSVSAALTTDSSSVPNNTELSATDKSFAGEVYPFPLIQATSTGVLQTGDDCDEIEFKVEYDVVNSNEIAFFLEPGRDKNNTVLTWWKKIAIPVIGNGEVGIEIQDGYSATKKVLAVLIDKTRGIAFGKAKILGVHTGLAFTWNVWPAIVGGCRVTFVWRRDSCKQ